MKKALNILVVVVLFLLLPSKTLGDGNKFTLAVSPSIIEFNALPPQTLEAKIRVKNLNNQEELLQIRLIPILPEGKNGEISLSQNQDLKNKLFEKVKLSDKNGQTVQEINLAPFREESYTIIINTDNGDLKKDLIFAVAFVAKDRSDRQSTNQLQNSWSKIQAGVASLVLVKTAVNQQPLIIDFSTSKIIQKGPVSFTLLLKNNNSHLEIASGTVNITNMFGKAIAQINLPNQIIPANSEKYLRGEIKENQNTDANSIIWDNQNIFGIYKANLNLNFDNGKTITRSAYFTALPVLILTPIILSALFLISVYLRVKNKL